MAICSGIENVSGVGCHLSSAIVILCYALVPLRNALLHILQCHERALLFLAQQSDNNKEGIQQVAVVDPAHSGLLELGRLLQKMNTSCEDEAVQAVDPSRVYNSFESQCNPFELGDATRALSMLLKKIRSLFVENDDNTHKDNDRRMEARRDFQLLYECLLGGTMQQELIGRKPIEITTETGQKGAMQVRRKRKNIALTCPFPLDGSCDSVSSALYEATQPVALRGYNWDGADDEYEEWVESCEDVAIADHNVQDESHTTNDWQTTKQTSFGSLPTFLLFHLRRFALANGRLEASDTIFDVPLQVNVTSLVDESQEDTNSTGMLQQQHTFELVGGILHADEGDKEDVDYEGGHYVAICRCDDDDDDDTVSESTWCLINDEKVTILSQSVALDVLAGRPDTFPDGPCMRGTLLVYSKERSGDHQNNDLSILEKRFRESLAHMTEEAATFIPTKPLPPVNSQRPEDLVGKRLRIRWAKGKFYAGKVISYNETNGKHCVEYDDGDVREYKLHKKTIEWEDEDAPISSG